MNKPRSYQAIRAHVSGGYTTGTLHGKEYIVVPVVALVEGVIQGMAAEGPELALAEEFGKFPDSWNGRPIVMSHPTVNGAPVSANSPDVLHDYQIGYIFNSQMDDTKLGLEAWVDPDIMANLNDDSKEILEILQAGTMIEVSTGYFAEIEKMIGMHNNQKYEAIQRTIVPDHLAFLPNGTLGACSNADGCGAQLAVNAKKNDPTFKPVKTFRVEQPCCEACANGHECEGSTMPNANKDMADEDDKTAGKKKKKQDPKAYEEVATTIANTIAGGVTLSDARDVVCEAIKSATGNMYSYVLAMTTSKVVYEMYNTFSGYYMKYQRSYSVSTDGVVTLGDDVEEVRLMTKVVAVNAEDVESEENPEQNMTTQNNGAAAASTITPAANAEPKKPVKIENESGTLEVTFNEAGEPASFSLTPKVQAAPVPKTAAEFVAQAPKEIQEVLNMGMKLHQQKVDGTIKALKDSGRCKFNDDQLKAMSLDTLEAMAELANVPRYDGQAAPHANADLSTNAGESNFTAAPLVFEAPKLVSDTSAAA
jgi:hypothetical protein